LSNLNLALAELPYLEEVYTGIYQVR